MSAVRLDHVAIAVHRLADAVPVLVGRLGGVPDAGAPSEVFRWGTWRFAGGGRIEAIEPRGEDGFLHRFLARRGPGIHHVTFKVPSLRAACERAAAHGYRVVGYDDRHPHWKEAFLHPKEALGIVVQLAEASGRPPRRAEPPPGLPDPPPPVTVVGLRMRARSAERARVQWGSLLEGAGGEEDGLLVYRWPESPLRLAVEVDPGAEEGPLCIEVTSPRALELGPGPQPGLGTVFTVLPARPAARRPPSSS
jgi:methylmalonyl-CoA/ethylmalonyl-CoA epimerase